MDMVVHLVAHASRDARPFLDFDVAKWTWDHLQLVFTQVFAAVLMPDHLHLIAVVKDAIEAQRRLTRLLADLQRHHGEPGMWARIPKPEIVRLRDKLLGVIRYVLLNPCRAKWVTDPLLWIFSTLRDNVGAVVEPWVVNDDLARALGVRPADLPSWLHARVSADSSVAVASTPLRRAAEPVTLASRPLADIIAASAACHRAQPTAIRQRGPVRSTFLALADEQGWRDPSLLAAQCEITTRAIRKSRAQGLVVPPAARSCLGDSRLLTVWPPPRTPAQLRVA
jgi:hypothetical protein